jgi:hypothetical protein
LERRSICPLCRRRVQARGNKRNDSILEFAIAARADGIGVIPTQPNDDNNSDEDDAGDDVVGCTADDYLLGLSDTPADDANALPDMIDNMTIVDNGVAMLPTSVGKLSPVCADMVN